MKIRCVCYGNTLYDLTLNKEYKVLKKSDIGYTVKNDKNKIVTYFKYVFKVITKKESNSMKIKCIDNNYNNYGKVSLTVNKIYLIKGWDYFCYLIEDDEGKYGNYYKERFEFVTKETKNYLESYEV